MTSPPVGTARVMPSSLKFCVSGAAHATAESSALAAWWSDGRCDDPGFRTALRTFAGPVSGDNNLASELQSTISLIRVSLRGCSIKSPTGRRQNHGDLDYY